MAYPSTLPIDRRFRKDRRTGVSTKFKDDQIRAFASIAKEFLIFIGIAFVVPILLTIVNNAWPSRDKEDPFFVLSFSLSILIYGVTVIFRKKDLD